MNIIFLGGFTYPAGMAGTRRIQLFIDYFKKHNHSVKVLVIRNDTERHPENNKHGIYKGIEYASAAGFAKGSITLLFTAPFVMAAACRYLLKWKKKDNILYVYNGLNIENILAVLFARALGYKVIVDIVEELYSHKESLGRLAAFKVKSNDILEKNILLFADMAVVISSYLEGKLLRMTGNKIPVVKIPVSSYPVKQGVKKENDRIIFLYTGSFGKKDSVEMLLSVFTSFSAQYRNCVMHLSGYGNNVEELLSKHNTDKIKYLGFLNDEEFNRTIAAADVLCVTRSSSDYANAGFPFKLGEYLATGNPVIVSNVSDVSLYLEDKKDALIVEPDNPDALLRAMMFVVDNRAEAEKIGLNGKKKWEHFFNADINSSKLENYIEGGLLKHD